MLLARPSISKPRKRAKKIRGWRSFATLSVMNAPVVVEVNGIRHDARADRGGFIDVTCSSDLSSGLAGLMREAGLLERPRPVTKSHTGSRRTDCRDRGCEVDR
ncbi:MAG: hypothetical protein HOV71_16050 [Hamadaea sp.]|nr:hypothetical protein [Hamadaea sp.]NUR49643.1 hypothetical protein [Hamadaea sp.]NUT08259.1 hypothetical protein [Hamadaea sp.]